MIRLKKILFPTDFSRCANQAFWRSLYLSRKFQAELHMLHAIVLHDDDPHNAVSFFPDISAIHKQLAEIGLEKMDLLIESYHADDINVKKVERRGIAPAPVILDYASENDIDLIVLVTHGRRGLEHVFLGSVAEEVVRLAKCPVLTMREREKPHPEESLNRILVPIDFSHYAHHALLFAKEIAATYKSRLQVLHVIEQSKRPDFYFFSTNPNPNLIQNIRKKSKEKIEQLLNTVKEPNVAADIHIIEGQAARDIVKFADENDTDLVVISSHGLTGYEQLLIGGVAEKVVRMSTSPVFTVKTFGNSKIIS